MSKVVDTDAFWDKLHEALVDALDREGVFSYTYCGDVADNTIDRLDDTILDGLFISDAESAGLAEFLEHIRRKYYATFDVNEQRDLEKFLILLYNR